MPVPQLQLTYGNSTPTNLATVAAYCKHPTMAPPTAIRPTGGLTVLGANSLSPSVGFCLEFGGVVFLVAIAFPAFLPPAFASFFDTSGGGLEKSNVNAAIPPPRAEATINGVNIALESSTRSTCLVTLTGIGSDGGATIVGSIGSAGITFCGAEGGRTL